MHLFIAHRSRLVGECLKSALANERRFRATVLDPRDPQLDEQFGGRQGIVLLVDLALEDRAVQLVQTARQRNAQAKIVVLAPAVSHELIAECICAGADGCVLENSSLNVLSDAIRQVCEGETFCSPEIVWSLLTRFASREQQPPWRKQLEEITLTPREQEVLRLIASHQTNKQIAKRLSVSLYTVKNHVHNILEKLRVDSRQQAVEHAQRQQWLDRFSLSHADAGADSK